MGDISSYSREATLSLSQPTSDKCHHCPCHVNRQHVCFLKKERLFRRSYGHCTKPFRLTVAKGPALFMNAYFKCNLDTKAALSNLNYDSYVEIILEILFLKSMANENSQPVGSRVYRKKHSGSQSPSYQFVRITQYFITLLKVER